MFCFPYKFLPVKNTMATSSLVSLPLFIVRNPVLPTLFIEESVFTPLYVFAFFVKYYLTIKTCIYFWALYSVPFIYVSVLCQYQTVLITVALQYRLISCTMIPPTLFFFLRIAEAIQDHFGFHINFWNIVLDLWNMPLVS